jgi:predicted lactoylglutathione lyase
MAQMIFVNLPVADLARARAFFAALGWRFDERFCDETAAMVSVGDSDTIHAMLLTHDKFRQFTSKAVADTRTSTEVLLAISRESREEVDALLDKARAAGAAEPRPAQDYGFMYQRTFEDPDGHTWEVAWMDVEAAMSAGAAKERA